MNKPKCSVPGCANKVLAKGLCNAHYERMRRRGTTDPARPNGVFEMVPTDSLPTPENFKVLRRARIADGIKYSSLANRAGVADSQLIAWEHGHTIPLYHNFEAWANTLGFEVILVRKNNGQG